MGGHLRLKLRAIYYVDTSISNLRLWEKVCITIFVCLNGAQVECFKQKNSRNSRDTVPLSGFMLEYNYFLSFHFSIGVRLISPHKLLGRVKLLSFSSLFSQT